LFCIKYIVSKHPYVNDVNISTIFYTFTILSTLDEILFLDEYRIVMHNDQRKSIIQILKIKNIEELFNELWRV
jgi:hypothetical protein